MNKTTTVLIFFLGALLAGFFLVSREGFFQREVGMPLDTQAVEGATGVAGYNGTPPLLGSEPKPVPIRPYDMADDSALYQFSGNKVGADCCPSPFSSDQGCICLTDTQLKEFASRGGNRSMA